VDLERLGMLIPRIAEVEEKVSAPVSYRGTSLIRNTHPPRTTIGP